MTPRRWLLPATVLLGATALAAWWWTSDAPPPPPTPAERVARKGRPGLTPRVQLDMQGEGPTTTKVPRTPKDVPHLRDAPRLEDRPPRKPRPPKPPRTDDGPPPDLQDMIVRYQAAQGLVQQAWSTHPARTGCVPAEVGGVWSIHGSWRPGGTFEAATAKRLDGPEVDAIVACLEQGVAELALPDLPMPVQVNLRAGAGDAAPPPATE